MKAQPADMAGSIILSKEPVLQVRLSKKQIEKINKASYISTNIRKTSPFKVVEYV